MHSHAHTTFTLISFEKFQGLIWLETVNKRRTCINMMRIKASKGKDDAENCKFKLFSAISVIIVQIATLNTWKFGV